MTTYYLIWFIGGNEYGREQKPCWCQCWTYNGNITTDKEAARVMLDEFNHNGVWEGYYRLIEVREDELESP